MDEKKTQFTLEYPINCTVASLFVKLTTELGLESWFADRVEQDDSRFTFFWNKIPQQAELLALRENKYVRFRWDDEDDDEAFFEFTITPHELTGDVSLTVTDFAHADEYDDAVQMWDNSIKSLRRALGCRV
ncbi:MAG: SRPBCC domain-containing protein [Rikenellaceae bacterium]|nr:SRPBCC domain-containing protein [Rikenellaceae bacterium]